jgi:serine/threonine protein kinase
MSLDNFEAPSLEALAALLPAYDFEAFIAKGGMGAVYKARQRRLDRDVAIKILPRELGEDAEFVSSFETEARAMAKLNHPNLISVYDYGEVDGMPYIVMEYVNGKSLFHSAQNLAVDPGQAVGIVKGICDGLAHAHENGVIHRDIKPANILLTPRAAPKIGDFGLARPVDSDGAGLVMGTPGYVAPEVLHHPEKADRRSDLFALGVVLYELLIGRCPPYEGIIPPSKLSGCDTTLDRICEKAMNPVADERYQSAEEMSADLEAWLRKPFSPLAQPYPAPLPQQSPLGPRRAVPPTAAYHAAAVPRPVARKSSSGAVAGLVMLAIAIVVGAIGWSKFNSYRKAKLAEIKKAADQVEKAFTLSDGEEPVPPVNGKSAKPEKAAKPDKPAPKEIVREESPLKALDRLKRKLAAGDRSEMPYGSVALGDRHFMVIPTAMGWGEASAFAAEYGAHLFVGKSEEELSELGLLMPAPEGGAEAGLWIGAGSAGEDLWSWVDGTPWPESLKPQGEGPYLILDSKGGLQAREAGDRYPFAIQWRSDGTNPAQLGELLRRTGESITAGVPVYPAGTLQHESGRVFIASGARSFSEAEQLAASAGGKLMSVPTKELDDWLAGKLPGDGREGYWLGGTREEETWAWVSGEPWEYTRWKDETQAGQPGGRLKIIPGGEWENSYSAGRSSGFVIQWANANAPELRPSAPPVIVDEKLPPALMELEEKAKQLLANLEKDRDKELAANAKTFHWDLDTWMNDLSKNEVASWRRDVGMLKSSVRNNRVPAKISSDSGFRMSEQMRKVVSYCAEKQAAIDANFQAKAGKIRDSYVTRMNAALASAAPELKPTLQRRIAVAEDLEKWAGTLGVQGTKAVELAGGGGLKAVVGVWNWRGRDIFTFREDGTLQRRNGGNDGTWKMKSSDDSGSHYDLTWDGDWTVEVTVAPDGLTMDGKNPNGEVVQAAKIHQSAVAGGEDKVIGVWGFAGGQAVYSFGADGRAATLKDSGTWKFESEADGKRNYVVEWVDGGVDYLSMGADSDKLEGSNKDGATLGAKRLLP